jgi:hypothetical protein
MLMHVFLTSYFDLFSLFWSFDLFDRFDLFGHFFFLSFLLVGLFVCGRHLVLGLHRGGIVDVQTTVRGIQKPTDRHVPHRNGGVSAHPASDEQRWADVFDGMLKPGCKSDR